MLVSVKSKCEEVWNLAHLVWRREISMKIEKSGVFE